MEQSEPEPIARSCRITTTNGIGIKYLAIQPRNESGRCWATRWIVFFALPLLPLSRDFIQPIEEASCGYQGLQMTQFRFHLISRTQYSLSEVIGTLLLGWFVWPVICVIIPVICVRAGYTSPEWVRRLSKTIGIDHALLEKGFLVFGIIWGVLWWWIMHQWRAKQLFGPLAQTQNE